MVLTIVKRGKCALTKGYTGSCGRIIWDNLSDIRQTASLKPSTPARGTSARQIARCRCVMSDMFACQVPLASSHSRRWSSTYRKEALLMNRQCVLLGCSTICRPANSRITCSQPSLLKRVLRYRAEVSQDAMHGRTTSCS